MRVCHCALPAMHGGSTECCKNCPNNVGDQYISPYFTFNELTFPKKKITITEYDKNGKIKRITETEE